MIKYCISILQQEKEILWFVLNVRCQTLSKLHLLQCHQYFHYA